ncbi:MAG: (2Fe-2S) ferredoxin domain-containing protein [Cytophagaceae bacterium]
MGKNFTPPEKVIYVCTGSSCKKRGAKEIAKLFKKLIKDNRLNEISIIKTKCTDNCKNSAVVCYQPDNKWEFNLDEMKAQKSFEENILREKIRK